VKLMIDSFWRAFAYCLHPKVVLLSLLPLILMAVIVTGLGALYWDVALNHVRTWMEVSPVLAWGSTWLERMGLLNLKAVIAPLVIILAVTPVVMIMSLLAVSFMMTPALVNLVGARRFQNLERKQGGAVWQSLVWTLMSVILAMGALILTLPLWWIPPLAMLLPALIWGWLTYRVMTYDVLAEHASKQERVELMRRYRFQLLGMGVLTGAMGAAPSLVWASGALFAAAFVILIPIAVWIYTLVFVFSALWYVHFLLVALSDLRNEPLSFQSDSRTSLAEVVDVESKVSRT
jgi:hypothetical protein